MSCGSNQPRHDLVKFQSRRYSPDERRFRACSVLLRALAGFPVRGMQFLAGCAACPG
jgi:hypothetical protein